MIQRPLSAWPRQLTKYSRRIAFDFILRNPSQFIIEGFEIKAMSQKLDELGIHWQRDEKSLSLLELITIC